MKKRLTIPLLLTCFHISAAAKVDYLNVDGDIVYFTTTEGKATASPSCVVNDTQKQWSVSLNSGSGRALYSLLATALAGELAVTVTSAQDCGDTPGIERASSIAIAANSNVTTGAKSFYLYKGDGTTQLGRIISVANGAVVYLSSGDNTRFHYYRKNAGVPHLRYLEANCQGTAFTGSPNEVSVHPLVNNGHYMKAENYSNQRRILSNRSISGEKDTCYNMDAYFDVYNLNLNHEDKLCGTKPCMIKDE
ncbi:hypothetical protein CJF42_15115 [Pseudoalteromonas sp. NBT06-2]|uniref:hypothetical protein n=1 Tax=Pseudoalteromonas sp. NBT06-2 TaxID=2025950 RepID=UPI000BA7A632|nr:hypothetical protein [Pseudoalteromonas sp. NBT06-2]PAJ73591.1 hypothetical protein CJF42_15115 [Pseudoalteromonas sp. NBT06-2]